MLPLRWPQDSSSFVAFMGGASPLFLCHGFIRGLYFNSESGLLHSLRC